MLSDPALNLAVTGPNPVQLLLYGGVLILIVMLMGVALLFIRHKFRSRQENSSPAGLTVEQLAAMKDQGLITPEEFARLRRIALGLDMGAPKRENSFLTAKEEVVDEIRATEEESPPAKESKDE